MRMAKDAVAMPVWTRLLIEMLCSLQKIGKPICIYAYILFENKLLFRLHLTLLVCWVDFSISLMFKPGKTGKNITQSRDLEKNGNSAHKAQNM